MTGGTQHGFAASTAICLCVVGVCAVGVGAWGGVEAGGNTGGEAERWQSLGSAPAHVTTPGSDIETPKAEGLPSLGSPPEPHQNPTPNTDPTPNPDPIRVPTHVPADVKFDRAEPMPLELVDVDLTERLGESIDLSQVFTASDGREVRLSDYFDGTTPVILNLTYFRCPMSCPVILQNLAMSLREVKLEPGVGYRVLTVSIDPTDSVAAAYIKQGETLETLQAVRPEAGRDDWAFLVGPGFASKGLADAVGYGFKYLPGPKQYTHRDVIIILSPEGKITRYIAGQSFPRVPLELALVEASDGKVGSAVDRFKLWFCHYDTGEKKYVLRAKRIMTAGGALTMLGLGGGLGLLWLRERRRRA